MSTEEASKPKCPKCGSTQIHVGTRGWSLLTGMIGANKVKMTCLNCGHTFKPGEGAKA